MQVVKIKIIKAYEIDVVSQVYHSVTQIKTVKREVGYDR